MCLAHKASNRKGIGSRGVSGYLKHSFVRLKKTELTGFQSNCLRIGAQGVEVVGQVSIYALEMREIRLELRFIPLQLVACDESRSSEHQHDETVGGKSEVDRKKETRTSTHI